MLLLPANAALNAVADQPDVIALSFAVTYWNQLGWTDRFAKPAFTARQRAYAASLRSDNVYTPQTVVNGRKAFVGSRSGALESVLKSTAFLPGTRLKLESGGVSAAAGPRPVEIWLVSYDPANRTLPHRNIVTSLQLIGKAGEKPLKHPPAAPAQSRILLLQQAGVGAVSDAVRL